MKKLGFGMMRLPLFDPQDPKSIDKEQVKKMVDRFLEQGFCYFDTAYMYHDYQSEYVVKEALVARHPRERFLLASKLPTMYVKEASDAERFFNEQLEKCGVEYFDYYLLHCLTGDRYPIIEQFKLFDFVKQKKEEGKVKHFGFSFHDSAEVLDKILTDHPEVEFVQLQINYLDWEDRVVQSRLCYETAVKHGKKVIVMEPVKGGTLARLPEKANKLFEEYGSASPASYAIRFAAGLENVMLVLSGMSDMAQMEDNISYMGDFKPLSSEERALTEEAVRIIRKANSVPCTACSYCTAGCPKNIQIPRYFALYNAALVSMNAGIEPTEQREEYAELNKTFGKASDCITCGQCEKACPQHIEIIKALKRVKKELEE